MMSYQRAIFRITELLCWKPQLNSPQKFNVFLFLAWMDYSETAEIQKAYFLKSIRSID